ncbi:MAG TPA: hypothetical protein PLI94_08400 [Bacillota bacterium]|jgi:hypothetical protein|nr:hypothetical protein [Bacillota bacterium]HPT68044.1 hypothetical protein [Bacillota bacterium]
MRSISPKNLEQAVADVIKVIDLEETVLSHILELVKEMIQQAKENAVSLEQFVSVNESADSIIKNIAKIQVITKDKLQQMRRLAQLLSKMTQRS